MRPIDRYRKRYQKNTQSTEESKNKSIDWDFLVEKQNAEPSFSITLDDADNESPIERFERYIRQLSRCIHACSLCERGCDFYTYKHYKRSPHSPPSIWHKKVAFIKYEPDDSDIFGLFKDEQLNDLLKKYETSTKDFYCTSIIKCLGKSKTNCPYFNMEWQAISDCLPQLLILFDKKSADHLKLKHDTKTIQKYKNSKVACIGEKYKGLETILKILSNHQIRNRLIS